MNSICLSAAPNLRCDGLTRIQNIALLVPPAVELVFSFTLALSRASDSGYTNWLLVADGLIFLLLAVLDFLSHIIPQASSTLAIFKIIDFVLAGASFLPILAYMLFLFLYARTHFIPSIPTRLKNVVVFSLFTIIPVTIAFNELGSLLGISHKVVLVQQKPVLEVGFTSATTQRAALVFSSGTVALSTVFQASIFTLSFIRLVRAFLDERRVESIKGDPDAPDEIHLFRGLGWFAGGLKLGAIESVIGFVNVSFETAFARRVIRLFARGTLIIGVIKGMNMVEDFVRFESDYRARRSSFKRLSHRLISNPRFSTFREMSPQASSFHAAQRDKRAARHGPSPLALGADSTHNAFRSSSPPRKERVTVVYDGKTPPVLQLRFSALDVPLPPMPAPAVLSTIPEVDTPRSTPRYTPNPFASGRNPPSDFGPPSTAADSPEKTHMHTHSARTDSLEAVRDITGRFPVLPARALPGSSPLSHQTSDDYLNQGLTSGFRSVDVSPSSWSSGSNTSPEPRRKPKPPPLTIPQRPQVRPPTLDLDRTSVYDPEPPPPIVTDSASVSPISFAAPPERRPLPAGQVAAAAKPQRPPSGAGTIVDRKRRERLSRLRFELRSSGAVSDDGHEVQSGKRPRESSGQLFDLRTPSSVRAASTYTDDEESNEAMLDEAWRRAGLQRVKTVSRVHVHTTPHAEQNRATRVSLIAVEEEIELPESYDDHTAVLAQSPVRLTRLDSGVLGEEDRRLVRQGLRS